MLANKLWQHTTYATHIYMCVQYGGVKIGFEIRGLNLSPGLSIYQVSPLVFSIYGVYVNVISVESPDIATTQMVLNLLKMMDIEILLNYFS